MRWQATATARKPRRPLPRRVRYGREGMSLRAIGKTMAERGFMTSGGKPYGANAVLKMVAGAS